MQTVALSSPLTSVRTAQYVALIGVVLIALLLQTHTGEAIANAGYNSVRASIESELVARGADKQISKASFEKVVDALAQAASQKGITPQTIAVGNAATAAAARETFATVQPITAVTEPDAANTNQDPIAGPFGVYAILVSVAVLAALLFGIWRRRVHLMREGAEGNAPLIS